MSHPFIEQRISGDISYGSSYSDEYNVVVTRTAGGARYPKLTHPYPQRRFRLIFRENLANMWADIVNLYHRCYGTYYGFRAKAFDDFTTRADGRSAPTKDDQTLVYISAGVYQLRKQYGLDAAAGGLGYPARTIYKPVTGTVVLAKNGTLISSGVTVDTTTGRVTISPAPSYPGDVITGGCEFDIPVVFASPITIDQSAPYVRMIESVELEELVSP